MIFDTQGQEAQLDTKSTQVVTDQETTQCDVVTVSTPTTNTVSWDEFSSASEELAATTVAQPRILNVGKDAAYVSMFTKNGVPVQTHYLEEADGFTAGYVHCIGEGCPACRAGLKPSEFLLLPVFDHITGEVAILRISTARGAGKLLTEIGKVMNLPNPDNYIAKISRPDRYTYSVEIKTRSEADPDAIRKVQAFNAQYNNGEIDLAASITKMSASEMTEHPRIAKTLQLEGAV